MTIFTPGLITAEALFILSLASGAWLSHLGKPINIFIVTIHKLISLATVLFTGLAIFHLSRAVTLSSSELSAMVVTSLLFLFLFITGALLSAGKPVNGVLSVTHKIAPLLSVISTAVTIFLLAGGK
jgi:hypothetical protein